MGALATPSKWIPEDDLLLKNAVEAGASLESLAKGAVCFSRRFTLRELLERWHSLLYDPEVSSDASARMIEFENELSSSNPPKANRTCLKVKDSSPEKRKADSIRNHYHAWRKRICNRPYDSLHTDLPEELCSEIMANCGYDSRDSLNCDFQQHQGDNIPFQEHKINNFGDEQTGYHDNQCAFPSTLRFSSNAANGTIVQNVFHNTVIDRCRDRVENQNPLHVYTGNLCLEPGEKTEFNNDCPASENDFIQKGHSQEANLPTFDAYSEIHKIKQAEELPMSNQFVDEDAEVKPLSITGLMDSNDGTEENNIIRMQVSHWGTIPGIPGETMRQDVHLDSEEDDNNELNASRFDNTGSEANINGRSSDDGINNSLMVAESDDVMEYMGFGDDDDFLFLNVDDKDLGSILLNSPSDIHQDDIPNSIEQKETEALPVSIEIPYVACFEERNRNEEHMDIELQIDRSPSISAKGATSTSDEFHTFGPLERLPVCVLNTEDPEIPSNDHISTPAQLVLDSSALISIPTVDERSLIGDSVTVKEEQLPVMQSSVVPFEANSVESLNVGPVHSVENFLVEVEPFEKGLAPEAFSDVHISSNNECMLQDICPAPDGILEENQVKCGLQKQDNFNAAIILPLEKPASGLGNSNMYSQSVINGFQNEVNMQALHNCAPLAELSLPQPAAALSTSDVDERLSDSEDEVPNFSDIEAMILDMDLGPYNQESCLFNKEVLQYQPIRSKKTIVRLEQGARAYMDRKLSSHGAFAVFYGRHLKYFVRTPQISLGRATEDVKVDIDLGREGRANKISRRQAIIKMDDDGSFFLKNVGKYSIFLNSREVISQKCVNLASGSLIEIRNLRFIFEINQSAVRSYIATSRKGNQGKKALYA